MTLFDRVSELAQQQGLSVFELSEKLNLSRNSIYSWKKSSPKAETLQLVANYFHVSTDYLLGRTDNPNTKNEISEIKKPKVKMLARKMDDLDDSQLDALDNLVNQFFDKKFDKGSDENK